MLSGRLYRAAFAPFLIALTIAAFSLTARPGPLVSTLAPDAFDGPRAYAELMRLAAEFPERRPGSEGDERLAQRVVQTIGGLGDTAGGGFSVRVERVRAQTIDGEQTLQTVIAQRPGATGERPIVILAHRDAAARGSAAQLSGTAALIELARVFAARETQRTIVLVSTSGGSGGDAGAADFAAHSAHAMPGPFDAAIVLGDVASTQTSAPLVVPYSDGYGSAPDELRRTVAGAIRREVGVDPGAPSVIGQLAHLAFPFAAGEQGVLAVDGLPAVLMQVSGERGPASGASASAPRLNGFGRAALAAVDALDGTPDIESTPQTGLVLARQIVPAWALRLLIGTLLIPPAVVLIDGLARARRRREPLVRWTVWTLTCALPFLVCALFAQLLGVLGAISATPLAPTVPSALPFDGDAATAVLSCVAVLGLAWLAWPTLVRRLGLAMMTTSPPSSTTAAGATGVVRPVGGPGTGSAGADAAGIATLLVLLLVACVAWAFNPYAALLVVPGLHLLLPVADAERRPRSLAGLGLLALALVPLALLIAFYAHQLGYGPGGVAQTAVLLLAGGHVGVLTAAVWCVALGCGVAIALIALTAPADPVGLGPDERSEVTIRGPLSYAGPGSLGGTESALRR
jgi:Peptidase family M28